MVTSNCINLIKISIKHKKKGFIIINNKKNLTILKAFLKLNIIKFIKIDKEKLIVYINYFNEKPIFNNIINMFKPGNKKYLTLKNLKKINKKYNWIFLISSNKGIINSYEAIKLNTGGLLLAKLWN